MAETSEKLTAAQISGLGALLLGALVITNDFTALNVALPAIEKSFNSDLTTVQWVISGYVLVFGVSLVTAGRLADMFGRRIVFFIGMSIFAVFSLIGGLAEDVWMLLVARAVMGIGGAMAWPSLLAMIYTLLPEEKAALAGGLIMAIAGIGNAMGPMLGGAFTEYLSWRWIFFINVPVGFLAMAVIYAVLEKDKVKEVTERVDYPGIVTLTLGLFALLLLLDIGSDLGWLDPRIIVLFLFCGIMLALFFFIERRTDDEAALVPRDVMANRNFRASNLTVLLVAAIYFGAIFYLPQFMVKELGYSAARAGVGLAPLLVTFAIASLCATHIYNRIGPKLSVCLGNLCLAGGIFILSRLDASSSYLHLVPGMMVVGVGLGIFYTSIFTVAVTSFDQSRSGLANAVIYMTQNAGGAVGLGLTTAIVVTASTLPGGITRAFTVNAVLGLGGILVCLFFVAGPLTKETLLPPRKEESGEN